VRDGSQYGGTKSTDISRINRRCYWLRLDAGPGVSSDGRERAVKENASAQHLSVLDKPKSYQRRGFSRGGSPMQPGAVGYKPCWAAWLIPIHEGHLRWILRDWVIHYNRGRPHASLGPGIPDPLYEPNQFASTGHRLPEHARVLATPILGGLHPEYRVARDAA
jgi:hypothetical protein